MENNNEEFDEPKVSMTLEDGTEFIALLPDKVIPGYEENEVFLYRYKELAGDDVELTPIDNEEEYEAAADAFDELLDEEEFNELA